MFLAIDESIDGGNPISSYSTFVLTCLSSVRSLVFVLAMTTITVMKMLSIMNTINPSEAIVATSASVSPVTPPVLLWDRPTDASVLHWYHVLKDVSYYFYVTHTTFTLRNSSIPLSIWKAHSSRLMANSHLRVTLEAWVESNGSSINAIVTDDAISYSKWMQRGTAANTSGQWCVITQLLRVTPCIRTIAMHALQYIIAQPLVQW